MDRIKLLAICALLALVPLGAAARSETAGPAPTPTATERLRDAQIFIEINDTGGDSGIQVFLDGEGWDSMTLTDPNGNEVVDITASGSIGMQGITELFFESAEPSFDEQPLDELLALFPEGVYRFRGTTTEGQALKGQASLNHVVPDAPIINWPPPGGEIGPQAAIIQWSPVANPPGGKIVGYGVKVSDTGKKPRVFTAQTNRSTTVVTIPPEFLDDGTEYNVEVWAQLANGNQTLSERPFSTQ